MAGVVWSLYSLYVILYSETRRTFSDNMQLHLYLTWRLKVTTWSFLQLKTANYSDLKGFTFDVYLSVSLLYTFSTK